MSRREACLPNSGDPRDAASRRSPVSGSSSAAAVETDAAHVDSAETSVLRCLFGPATATGAVGTVGDSVRLDASGLVGRTVAVGSEGSRPERRTVESGAAPVHLSGQCAHAVGQPTCPTGWAYPTLGGGRPRERLAPPTLGSGKVDPRVSSMTPRGQPPAPRRPAPQRLR